LQCISKTILVTTDNSGSFRDALQAQGRAGAFRLLKNQTPQGQRGRATFMHKLNEASARCCQSERHNVTCKQWSKHAVNSWCSETDPNRAMAPTNHNKGTYKEEL
jgi:hypothetical protein